MSDVAYNSTAPQSQILMAWVQDESVAVKIKKVAADIADLACEISIVDAPVAAASDGAREHFDIGLVELSNTNEDQLAKLEQLAQTWRSDARLIVMLHDADEETVQRLAKAGVDQVLSPTCTEAELKPALELVTSVATTDDPHFGLGKIVTVIKSSGGCGSSMIAANLAAEFSQQGNESAALVDLDIQFGNLGLYLDLRPRHTLLEALQAGSRLDETLLETIMESHESGVDLLAAPRHMVPLDQIGPNFVLQLIRLLRKIYPVTVIELPSGWGDWFVPIFEQSDHMVVVCEATVRGASGLRRVMQSLEDMSFDGAPLTVIANKVQRMGDTGRRVKQMRETLDWTIETLRFDEKSADRSVNAGMLFYQIAKRTKAHKDLSVIAGKIQTMIKAPSVAEMQARKDRDGRTLEAPR